MNKKYMIMTDKGFKSWVQDMNNSWIDRDMNVFGHLDWFTYNDSTVIINRKNGKTSVAERHTDDSPDEKVGLAVAWARYRGLKVPVTAYPCAIKDLKYEDHFIYNDHKYLFRMVERVNGMAVINCYDFDDHIEKRIPTLEITRYAKLIYKLK